jgi:hypothetical protein
MVIQSLGKDESDILEKSLLGIKHDARQGQCLTYTLLGLLQVYSDLF